MLTDTWHLFYKYFIITVRMPMWSLFGLIQPLLWLIIFSALFSHFAQVPGFPAASYVDYFIPGVLVMTVLFGSSWAGVSLLREINAGTVDKMLVSPVSRSSIVLSRVVHSAVQVVFQAIIILIAAWIMGGSTSWNPINILLAMLIILILGVTFASLSNGLAITLQREEPLVIMGNMMTLPLMFFSSAMVPKQFLPTWIQYASVINPVEHATTSIRAILSLTPDPQIFAKGLMISIVFMIASLVWSISAFNALRD